MPDSECGRRNGGKKSYIIDRFEGGFAVCEREGTTECVNVPRTQIDSRAAEGSVIVYDAAGGRYLLDAESTRRRAEHMRTLAKGLWK